jgi:predicted unusual protein kinase regulating ubiquinone biosynthesis (AarF/ABC1/UbiB family)
MDMSPPISWSSVSVLRTSTLVRGARLAALPTMYAGRTALGAARKVGGAPAEAVATEVQRRTIEQLCRTLGELKGGALKLGQALSVLEAVLPEELAAPYRTALNALQHAAPPLPYAAVERVLSDELGPRWPELLTIEPKPAGAASIGQVHRGVWLATGQPVAIKIQYPGVAKALRSDLRQLGRVARLLSVLGALADATGLVEELAERLGEELDYRLEADNQRAYAAAFAEDPLVVVPPVLHATEKVLVTGWLDGEPLSARIHDEELSQERRDRVGACLVHAIYAGPERAGLLHADPHPGNFMLLPDGRLGLLDFGAVKRLPDGIPAPLGRNAALVLHDQTDLLRTSMVELGFLPAQAPVTDADLLDYLTPMSEPFRDETFTFTRGWLRREAVKLANPRSGQHVVAKHLQLPPEYLMVHRVALGMVGLLCQLQATVALRDMELRWSPGFRATVADHTGADPDVLLDEATQRLEARYGRSAQRIPVQRSARTAPVSS